MTSTGQGTLFSWILNIQHTMEGYECIYVRIGINTKSRNSTKSKNSHGVYTLHLHKQEHGYLYSPATRSYINYSKQGLDDGQTQTRLYMLCTYHTILYGIGRSGSRSKQPDHSASLSPAATGIVRKPTVSLSHSLTGRLVGIFCFSSAPMGNTNRLTFHSSARPPDKANGCGCDVSELTYSSDGILMVFLHIIPAWYPYRIHAYYPSSTTAVYMYVRVVCATPPYKQALSPLALAYHPTLPHGCKTGEVKTGSIPPSMTQNYASTMGCEPSHAGLPRASNEGLESLADVWLSVCGSKIIV
jgi:hypothetical protein